jgi:hypothetical protein
MLSKVKTSPKHRVLTTLEKGRKNLTLTRPHSLPMANVKVSEQKSSAETDALVPAMLIPFTCHTYIVLSIKTNINRSYILISKAKE